jgi:hypothetical protein
MPIEDKNELIRLVENGWRLYYDQRHDRFRAYDPSTKKMIRVNRSLNDVAKQLYKEMKKKKRSKDLMIEKVATDDTVGVKDVFKRLGEHYGEITSILVNRANWFVKALLEIGWHAMFYVLQLIKMDPVEFSRRLNELNDPDKFADFISSNLYNLVIAGAEGSKAIIEKENELKKCVDDNKRLQKTIERLRQRVEALERMLRAAEYTLLLHGLQQEYGKIFLAQKFLESI